MTFLSNILKNRSETAADLAAAITETEGARTEALRRIAALEDERPSLLLQAPDKLVRENEAEAAASRLVAERADVAIAELRRRHAEAVVAEMQADIDAQVAAARADAKRGAELLALYAARAAEMAGLMSELQEIRSRITSANLVRGERERVPTPESVAGIEFTSLSAGPVDGGVRLPTLGGMGAIWPRKAV